MTLAVELQLLSQMKLFVRNVFLIRLLQTCCEPCIEGSISTSILACRYAQMPQVFHLRTALQQVRFLSHEAPLNLLCAAHGLNCV